MDISLAASATPISPSSRWLTVCEPIDIPPARHFPDMSHSQTIRRPDQAGDDEKSRGHAILAKQQECVEIIVEVTVIERDQERFVRHRNLGILAILPEGFQRDRFVALITQPAQIRRELVRRDGQMSRDRIADPMVAQYRNTESLRCNPQVLNL